MQCRLPCLLCWPVSFLLRLSNGLIGAFLPPQGGIDAGEDYAAAAKRELEEETGVTSVTLVAEVNACIILSDCVSLSVVSLSERPEPLQPALSGFDYG